MASQASSSPATLAWSSRRLAQFSNFRRLTGSVVSEKLKYFLRRRNAMSHIEVTGVETTWMTEEILFLTELLGLKVFDLKGRRIGVVKDLAIVPLVDPVRVDRYLIGGGG